MATLRSSRAIRSVLKFVEKPPSEVQWISPFSSTAQDKLKVLHSLASWNDPTYDFMNKPYPDRKSTKSQGKGQQAPAPHVPQQAATTPVRHTPEIAPCHSCMDPVYDYLSQPYERVTTRKLGDGAVRSSTDDPL